MLSADAERYKVLAGFVMSYGTETEVVSVVSVATGSKVINGGRLILQCWALNDCHAEILARMAR